MQQKAKETEIGSVLYSLFCSTTTVCLFIKYKPLGMVTALNKQNWEYLYSYAHHTISNHDNCK